MKSARFPWGFRPVEEWKSALMVLPDSNFLQLMRSVFGNIKTPFNKQRLLDDLFVLLSRDEIRRTIAAYLDEQDHRIIAAIALLREPSPGELKNFFFGELSYVDLHALLVNLEERLILYRLGEDMRLALNPVLEPVLSPLVADRALLFPSFPVEKTTEKAKKSHSRKDEKGPAPAFVRDGRFWASLFAFISGEDDFFKSEGGIRKKILDEGKKFFPGLDLELIAGALRELGLFKPDGEMLLSDDRRVRDFAGLSVRERGEYWAAGVFLSLYGAESVLSGLSRSRIQGAALFIHRFCLLLDPRRRYPQITLRRFAELLGKEDSGGGSSWGSRFHENRPKFSFEHLLDTLVKTGFLEEDGEFLKTGPLFIPPESLPAEAGPAPGQPVIAMDTAFSFLAYPEISFADALALARFCSLKPGAGQGAAVCFELTRPSVVRGFDRGLSSTDMLELLGRLSGSRLEESLGWTLKDWEKRYSAVSLYQGTVLTLAEDMRYLAEAEPVASLISRTLGPGIYLLAQAGRSEAAGALRKAGVDIIAQPPLDGEVPRERPEGSVFFLPLKDNSVKEWVLPYAGISGPPPGEAAVFGDAESIKERLRKVLDGMKLSKPEKDELGARIERRLVLNEAQLEGTSIKYEKLEARGLDYVGKAAIAKQAIASGSLLEVSWPEPGGGTNRATGIPSALEKKDGESVLILKPPPGEDGEKEIPVLLAKISLIRRIKQSIFET